VAKVEAKVAVVDAAVKAEAKVVAKVVAVDAAVKVGRAVAVVRAAVADVKVDRGVRLRFTGQMFLRTSMTS